MMIMVTMLTLEPSTQFISLTHWTCIQLFNLIFLSYPYILFFYLSMQSKCHLIIYSFLVYAQSFYSQWPSNEHPIQQITCFIKNYISNCCYSHLYTNLSSLLIRKPIHSCWNKKRNWDQDSNNDIDRIECRVSYSLTLVSIRFKFLQR